MPLRSILALLGLAGLLFGVQGCRPPGIAFSETPEISIQSVSPTTVVAGALFQTLNFAVAFKDGDGDLGRDSCVGASGRYNIVIVDQRAGFPYTPAPGVVVQSNYASACFPPVTVENRGQSVQGTITIRIPLENIPLLQPTSSSEVATYRIYVIDRAGRVSNEIETPPITIRRN